MSTEKKSQEKWAVTSFLFIGIIVGLLMGSSFMQLRIDKISKVYQENIKYYEDTCISYLDNEIMCNEGVDEGVCIIYPKNISISALMLYRNENLSKIRAYGFFKLNDTELFNKTSLYGKKLLDHRLDVRDRVREELEKKINKKLNS